MLRKMTFCPVIAYSAFIALWLKYYFKTNDLYFFIIN